MIQSADATATGARWDSSSCVLIAYADTVSATDQPGLRCLQALLHKHFNGTLIGRTRVALLALNQ
jgi:sucrose phosphorylase